jgi:hypothetical protein
MGLARSAEKVGITYPQLLQIIVRAALEHSPYDTNVPMFPPLLADKETRRPADKETRRFSASGVSLSAGLLVSLSGN